MKYIHRFDKWSEFMDKVKHGKPNPLYNPNDGSKDITEPKWSGSSTYEEAIKMTEEGWSEGITKLSEFQRTLPSDIFDSVMPVREYKPELHHTIGGGSVDVAAHLSGATPETFIGERPPEGSTQITHGRKLQTIYINIGGLSNISPEALFYNGAYTYSLVEHLENCGYSCEVWLVNTNRGQNDAVMFFYCKAKEFGEMFETNKLAVGMCSAFMFRRFVFFIKECGVDGEIRDIVECSHGASYKETIDNIVLPEDIDLNPMWISMVNENNPEQMLKKFRKILDDHLNSNVIAA